MHDINHLIESAYDLFLKKDFNTSLTTISVIEKEIRNGNSLFKKDEIPQLHSRLENFKGYNLLCLDNYDKAQDSFARALELNPDSSQACTGLAETFLASGQNYAAKAMLEYAVELNPNNLFAVNELKNVNNDMGLDETHNALNNLIKN